ncbi:MAG TPA: response regulator [Xanthobacteraceae bacterium]|nr:response regulator [Xanthobacteraceae bacterium]
MSDPAVKMLIADEADEVRFLFWRTLRHAEPPIELVEASSGVECLHRLEQGGIDLAFIDVRLPEVSGLEAVWSARSRGINTFVTFMAGELSEHVIETARTLRAYEILTKPVGQEAIEAIVASYRRLSSPLRALVVDDSATVRALVRKVVGGSIFRIEVEEAADGEAALARCRAGGIDLVFLDFSMPGLDGLATLERLIAQDPAVKVVMISGRGRRQEETDALGRGAAAFLRKPFSPAHVDGLLHDLFDLRSPDLAREGAGLVRQFEVAIAGRTISLRHKPTGHVYEYLWFRDAPHLRLGQVRENLGAEIPARQIRADARHAALLELKQARLLKAVAA